MEIWTTLNLHSPGAECHDLVQHCIPFSSLDQLADILCMDGETLGKYLSISPKTLSRRAKAGHFSLRENERLYALIAVVQASYELFEGDVQAASRFLSSPLRGLNSKTPLEMLNTGGKSSTVIDLIGRLENGIPL